MGYEHYAVAPYPTNKKKQFSGMFGKLESSTPMKLLEKGCLVTEL
jgi:hypothetical protein